MIDFSGRVLGGKYTIEELLGAGGMGQVWRAYDSNLKRRVAIKFLNEDPSVWSKWELNRFEKEAQILAALDHSHILKVFDFGNETDGDVSLIYFVMSQAIGGSLAERMRHSSPLTFDEAEHIFTQVCQAVDYAHKKQVIHFDLKPSNILFDEAGNVLVADFGLAKILEEPTHIKASTWAGTFGYMAPEQVWGYDAGPESDVYALGIILYEMLTGETPKQDFDDDRPIVELEDFLPVEVKSVIEQATQIRRKERYASAGELARAFKEAIPHDMDEALIKEMQSRSNAPQAMAFSPNGRALAISLYASSNNDEQREPAVCIVDINTGQIQDCFFDHNDAGFHSPSFNYNGQVLAANCEVAAIYFWDTASGNILRRLDIAGVEETAFSPVGEFLAYACTEGTMILEDWNSNQPARQLEERGVVVSSIAFSPEGTLLASAYKDGGVRLWDTDQWQEAKWFADIHAQKVVFSPNTRFLAAVSPGKGKNQFAITMWDVEGGQRIWQVNTESDFYISIAFSPDNQMLAVGTGINEDACLELWDIKNKRRVYRELQQDRLWHRVVLNRQGCLASVNAYGWVQLYRP